MAKKPADADYEVGYGRPPKPSRFQKGRSGNPRGRPRRVEPEELDVAALLNEPVAVTKGGVVWAMPPFEAGLRNLAKRAILENDLKAACLFLRICEECGVMMPPRTPPLVGALVLVPRTWDWDQRREMFRRHGPPPWPGEPPKEP